jgi:hypothetical protein
MASYRSDIESKTKLGVLAYVFWEDKKAGLYGH